MAKERCLSQYVNLVDHAREDVVLMKDNSALAMFQVDGYPAQTREDRDLYRHREVRQRGMVGLASTPGLVFYDWACRGFADDNIYPKGAFRSKFAREVDRRYRTKLFDRFLYLNKNYIGVMLRPPRFAGERIGEQYDKRVRSKWFARSSDDDSPEDRIAQLDRICENMAGDLIAYHPRRLGWRIDNRGRIFSEIAEALMFAMTGTWRSLGVQAGRRLGSLFSERLIFLQETIEIRGPGRSAYAVCFGGKSIPEHMPPGALDGFKDAPFRSTVCNTFRMIPQQTALALMGRQQNWMVNAGDRAHSQIRALGMAMDEVQSGRMALGDHHVVAMAFCDNPNDLAETSNKAWHTLQDAGFQVAREDRGIEAAYASMLPGMLHMRPRPGAATSFNFASLASLHAFPAGQEKGRWGEPMIMLRTAGGTPYRFHPHNRTGVFNAFIYGESGSGKTTFIAMMLVQGDRLGVQQVVLDYGRGLEPAVRFLDGSYLALNMPTGLAPMKALTNSPEDLNHLGRYWRSAVEAIDGYKFAPEEHRRLGLGLEGIMSLPPKDRWLRDLCAFLPVSRTGARARLERFCWGAEYGGVADNPSDCMDLTKRVIAFDLTKYLNDPLVCGPVVSDILYRTNKLADGRPMQTVIDEAWRASDIPAFAYDTKDGMKTDRKRNAGVVFCTQSIGDAKRSAIGETIREQCKTVIGFAVERPSREDLSEFLRYNSREIDIIESMVPGDGLGLLSQDGRSVVVQMPLGGLDDVIADLSGNEENVRLLDDIRAAHGDNPGLLHELFHEKRREAA